MSDLWEPGPGPFEPFPDRGSELADALRQLREAALHGAVVLDALHMRLTVMSVGLMEWDDEMDNCYPNWPDP